MRTMIFLNALALAFGAGAALAQQPATVAQKVAPGLVDKFVEETFKKAPPDWQARIKQDDAQRICSESLGTPTAADAKKLTDAAAATVAYPADGVVLGDWKKGRQLAQRGTGGQFSDKPGGPIGGNCYACHQLSPKELSFGTIGPTLLEYGKIRKFKPDEAKAAYAKIYNAQAVQACSNMPRFGHNKFLSEQDMKDLTAYLFDPESPVNKSP